MNSSMESLCRICLGEGASTPIFEDFETSKRKNDSNSTVLAKLTLCFNDKFEDLAGYPRYICDSCLQTLNMVFDFIKKYKETCKIVQETLQSVVKQENIEYYNDEYNDEFVYEYLDDTLDDDVDFTFETLEPKQKILKTAETFELKQKKLKTAEIYEPKSKKLKIEFEDGAHFIEKIKPIYKFKSNEENEINTNSISTEEVFEKGVQVIAKNKPLCKLKTTERKKKLVKGKDENSLLLETQIKNRRTCRRSAETRLPSQTHKEAIEKPVQTNTRNYQTNRIASSLLEGAFVWNGEDWSPARKPSNSDLIDKFCNENPQEENDKREPQNLPKPSIKGPPDPVLCPTCGETFSNRDQWRRHCQNHLDPRSRRVRCSVCNKEITTWSLKRHMKTLHSSKKDFICYVCGKAFAFYPQLDIHIKGVHEKTIIRKPNRRLPCKFCDKDFITKKLLLIHERNHTGDRPFVCTVCKKSFTHEDYLREHMRLHTGECPFECPVCGRGYPHLGNMKSHMKNRHPMSELSQEQLSKIKPTWLKCKLQPQAVRISSSALEGVISTKIREMNGQEMKRIRSGRNRQGWMSPAEAEQKELLMDSARAWMELGPAPAAAEGGAEGGAAAEPATVEVGQPTRLLIQCTLPVGVGLRVTNCVAHDGLGEASQTLLDEAGCPVDETIFTTPAVHRHKHRSAEVDLSDLEPADLQRNIEEKANLKLAKSDPEYMLKNIMTYQHAVTTFAAFKFPDRAKLHLTCGIELCKGHCPVVDCKVLQKPQQTRDGLVRKARLDKDAKGVVIDRLEVFNSIEVLAPNIELEDEASIRGSRRIESEEEDFVRGFSPGDKTICLSPGKMALAFCVLGVIFLCAIAVAFASLVRARRRGRDPLHTSLSFYTGSKSLFSSSESSSSGLSGSKLLLTDSPYLDQHSSSSNNWPYSRAF